MPLDSFLEAKKRNLGPPWSVVFWAMAKGVALVGPQAPMRAASRSSRNRMMRVAASTATGLFLVVLAVGLEP